MIHVLIPSNFKEDTFPCLTELTETFSGVPLKVVLFHALAMPTSITELLMLPREGQEAILISTRFTRQCQQLEKEVEQVKSIEPVFFYGSTNVSFRNFLKANKIDVMVSPQEYSYQAISPFSQSPFAFMEKAGLPLITVAPRVTQMASAAV
ncbi:hypothetical protein [Rufibacter roseus]|uniref:Universal stress protein n=1 Tax=Rufibacter roseus TaxID=1567108 RepID=A0ABW2DMG5_9BACT|nr:hypothetical protein [Rufibacter roseus]